MDVKIKKIILFLFIITVFSSILINRKSDKIYFLTYGNENYKMSRQRIKSEADSLNIFDKTLIETDVNILNDSDFKKTLEDEYFKKTFEAERGGGYWIWKPYIINKHLSNMNDGDILVYADAGCTISNKSKDNFNKIFSELKNGKYYMVLNDNKLPEKIWTKGDVLSYHSVYDNDKILNSGQYEGGRIILIKNNITEKIINKWWETAKNNPNLFDDSKSIKSNKADFKENRHDQSNISILCKKTEKCIGSDLSFIAPTRRKD